MDPRVVVVPEGLVDFRHELSKRCEPIGIADIDFELVVERFLVAVLPRTSGPASRDRDAALLKRSDEYHGVVFTPIVRMEDRRALVMEERVRQSSHCEK